MIRTRMEKIISPVDNRAKSTIACTTNVAGALIGVSGGTGETREGNFSFYLPSRVLARCAKNLIDRPNYASCAG